MNLENLGNVTLSFLISEVLILPYSKNQKPGFKKTLEIFPRYASFPSFQPDRHQHEFWKFIRTHLQQNYYEKSALEVFSFIKQALLLVFLSYLLKFFQNNYSVELLPIVFSVKKEEVTQKCSVTKVFLKISQNSQKNTCARVAFLIKLQALVCTFINNRLWHRCFLVNFDKLLRAPFFIEHLQ